MSNESIPRSWDDFNLDGLVTSRFERAILESIEMSRELNNTPPNLLKVETFDNPCLNYQWEQFEMYHRISQEPERTWNPKHSEQPDPVLTSTVFASTIETLTFSRWKQSTVFAEPSFASISRYYLHYHLAKAASESLQSVEKLAEEELKQAKQSVHYDPSTAFTEVVNPPVLYLLQK